MSRRFVSRCLLLGWVLTLALPAWGSDDTLMIGSKKFTESVILGEIARGIAEDQGIVTRHKAEIGGTRALWNALKRGAIDVYPDYTGTLRHEILAQLAIPDRAALREALAARGLAMTEPLGFNNSYALGMREDHAARLGITRISELRDHPDLVFGFGNEFIQRADGWPGLQAHYDLPQERVRGLDHDLAYRGLDSGTLDVMELYTTDAEIRYYDIRVLADDRDYFRRYDAVYVYRADLAERHPGFLERLKRLEAGIDRATMVGMNAQAKLEGVAEAKVAADFLAGTLGIERAVADPEGRLDRILERTHEHLTLVAISLSAAILVAVPLGVFSWLRPAAGQVILGTSAVLQTFPSLALLVLMIPLLGIGGPPAIAALFLYSLLPIVRNTYAGLHDIPTALRESAVAMGLSLRARLRRIYLPLATRSILAGIKTAAVINVGTATLGALIGAGGYGQPILTGIRLDDTGMILEGALPAAALALTVQGLFELIERLLLPRSLRAGAAA